MLKRLIFILLFIGAGAALSYQGWQWYQHERQGESGLLPRVNRYWEAVRLNDHYTKYLMETPVKLEQVDPAMYNMQRDFNYRVVGYSFGKIAIEGERAVVEVAQSLALPDMGTGSFDTKVYDRWSFVDGEWYHGLPLGEKPAQKQKKQDPKLPDNPPEEPKVPQATEVK